MDEGNGRGEGATVLRNGIRVLQAFRVEEPAMGVTEIARRLDLHKSTVSRLLATLEQLGLVEREPDSGRFHLGLGVIGLAGPLLADLDVRRVAHPVLEALTGQTGETTALVVWSGQEAVSVEQVASPQKVKHTAQIGTRYAGAENASVRVFLAADPAAGRGRSAPDPAVERVRQDGYAVNDGETSPDEIGVAAPVRDHRGQVVAAVLLSAPRYRVPAAQLPALGARVRAAADEVTARLGGKPA